MASGDHLITYAEIADAIEQLPVLVKSARRIKQLSVRAAAAEAGVSFSTFARLELHGHEFDTGSLKAILRWLHTIAVLAPAGQEGGQP